jgi:hypothetical protein
MNSEHITLNCVAVCWSLNSSLLTVLQYAGDQTEFDQTFGAEKVGTNTHWLSFYFIFVKLNVSLPLSFPPTPL